MSRPLLLIHGYSADGLDFKPLAAALAEELKLQPIEINIGNYVSLNNEITIKDIAEGLDRAFSHQPALKDAPEFDAIVHSTGILVIRSWLTNYGVTLASNKRLAQLKHLIGVAPATWGSPQAHKGRTWLGALVKGDKTPGPDFMNAGDKVLDGLELGSSFTWYLSSVDLVGEAPYYGKGGNTPYVAVFIGNQPYEGLSSVANDPGTDGTVRWAGCGLNTRKITIDLTKMPLGPDGVPTTSRTTMTPWAGDRLNIPIIAVEGRNHATLISNPEPGMVKLIAEYLSVAKETDHDDWLTRAQAYGEPAKQKMLENPGKGAAGVVGAAKTFFGHLLHLGEEPMDGWQQFVVHARDERGDPVSDYMIQVLREDGGKWVDFEEMYTDVHAYAADQSFRCFHIRLPKGICDGQVPLRIRIQASTGTELMAYQGYGSDDVKQDMGATAQPVEIDLGPLGDANESLFHPFTTTMVEIVLNRLPTPLNDVSRIFTFLANAGNDGGQDPNKG
jgi:hypothetical protein